MRRGYSAAMPPASAPAITRHLLVRGRVQGVYYRASTVEAATRLGVLGWVRNRRDGSVEAVLAGPAATVAEMIEACRRGPASARVEAVDATPVGDDMLGPRHPGERFSVLSTV